MLPGKTDRPEHGTGGDCVTKRPRDAAGELEKKGVSIILFDKPEEMRRGKGRSFMQKGKRMVEESVENTSRN